MDIVTERDDFEELCERGRIAARDLDRGRFVIGDLALRIETQYGRDTVGEFARQVNVQKKRVYEYRDVCSIFDSSARAELFENAPTLTYTHLRISLKIKDETERRAALENAADNTLTTDDFARKVSSTPGAESWRRVGEFKGTAIEVERWLVALRNGGSLNGKTLRVVLSELEVKQ
jgi:hypothetical protein